MPGFVLSFLAAAALPPADVAVLDERIVAIFAPYRDAEVIEAPWERDIWSKEIAHLITHWQSVVPEDEVDELNDGDWLCQCQDWDPAKFGVKIISRKAIEPDVAEMGVDIDIGWGENRDAFLVFRREGDEWRLDDLFTEGLADGIKDALHRTIVADEEHVK